MRIFFLNFLLVGLTTPKIFQITNGPLEFCEEIHYPTHIPHLDDPLIIGLGPLTMDSIKSFLRIEQPEVRDNDVDDNEPDFKTIGELYHTIEAKMKAELRDSDFNPSSCKYKSGHVLANNRHVKSTLEKKNSAGAHNDKQNIQVVHASTDKKKTFLTPNRSVPCGGLLPAWVVGGKRRFGARNADPRG